MACQRIQGNEAISDQKLMACHYINYEKRKGVMLGGNNGGKTPK